MTGAAEPLYLRMLAVDRGWLRQWNDARADPGTEGYLAFLEEIRQRTRPGDSIVILAPYRRWQDGYDYALFRASYVLAGREVLPILDREGRLLRENLERAEYAAAWKVPGQWRGFSTVWQSAEGQLARKTR